MFDHEPKAPDYPKGQKGRAAYVVLYALGVPVGVLLVLWMIFGNNLFGPG